VISRVDGVPHIVGGATFTVDSQAFRDINLLIDNFEHNPEAIDEQYVVLPEDVVRPTRHLSP
jgi:hypothetical protein